MLNINNLKNYDEHMYQYIIKLVWDNDVKLVMDKLFYGLKEYFWRGVCI